MRKKTTREDGNLEFKVIKDRKVGRRFIGVLKVTLAGKGQGKKLTATFNDRTNADVLKAAVPQEWLG